MAQPFIYYVNNDMVVRIAGVQSSTMGSTSYVNDSTGLSYHLWKARSTASTANRLTTAAVNIPAYSTSTGDYRATIQSTAYSITSTMIGFVQAIIAHGTLNGEWRIPFRGQARGTT